MLLDFKIILKHKKQNYSDVVVEVGESSSPVTDRY